MPAPLQEDATNTDEVATSQQTPEPQPRIVAIGASAGGLDALKTFFERIPGDTIHSFVVIQHLSPDYKSMMAELLAKNTELTTYEAQDGMEVEPGSIYLIPPKRNMTIQGGRLRLTDKPRGHTLPLPIDIFFSSLAKEKGEQAVAVVLTGTGSDGTSGIRAVKEVGGVVMVQDPNDAAFDGMPRSAIRTGLVDYTLPVAQLPGELLLYLQHPAHMEPVYQDIAQDKKTFGRILNQVRHVTDTDFMLYKRPTLARRIERRMSITKCDSLASYLNHIYEHPAEAHALRREFLIGVTRFFRDEPVWEVLQKDVLRKLIREKAEANEVLRVWSVGCSTGDEVYSLAILIQEEMRAQGERVDVKIFATDIDKAAIDMASQGVYSESIVSDVSAQRLSRYFVSKNEGFAVTSEVRKMVVFTQHNILHDPPFSRVDLVVCRNVLIYLNQQAQEQAMDALHYALNLGGTLLLGSSETIGDYDDVFEEVDRKSRLYRNVDVSTRSGGRMLSTRRYTDTSLRSRAKHNDRNIRFAEIMNKVLVSQMGIVSIFVNDQFDILEANGPMRKFVELPDEGYSSNLMNLLPTRLAVSISTGARRAKQHSEDVMYKAVELVKGDQMHVLDVIVRAFSLHEHSGPTCYNVILVPHTSQPAEADHVARVQEGIFLDQQVADLEQELKDTRQNLQAMVEEVETSNEELQATNEELLAANEELQSTNEELQSMNEELHTVNMELYSKIEDLAALNADMDNLLRSTQIGTVFLDEDLRIRKFTPAIRDQFRLQATDLGRPISHFSSTFPADTNLAIFEQAKQVLRTHMMHEREVRTAEGIWYLLRLMPFNSDERISGVLLSFIDITERKAAALAVADREHRLAAFVKALPGLAFVVDEDGRYHEVFTSRTEQLMLEPDQFLGKTLHEVMPEEPASSFMKVIRAASETGSVQMLDYPLPMPEGERWYHAQVAPMDIEIDGKQTVLWVAYDITERKGAEEALRKTEEQFKLAVAGISAGVWDWNDVSSERAWWSPRFYELLGYEPGEIDSTLDNFMEMVHPDDRERTVDLIDKHMKGEEPYSIEYRVRTKDGFYKWFLGSGQVQHDDDGTPLRMVGSIIDIDERKRAEEALRYSNAELEQFAYITSHDLQEPLRTITSFSQRLHDDYRDQLGERAQKYLHFMAEAAQRMHSMINELLTYSRIGHAKEHTPVDTQVLVRDLLSDLSSHIEDKDATVEVGTLPRVMGNAMELRRLFQNLVSNALKFSREGVAPHIRITSEKHEGVWKFQVADNGIGIPPEHHGRVFEIFQRLHERKRYEGTGIGLAQCIKILHAHGGTIRVAPEPGEGTTIIFTLPIASHNPHSVPEPSEAVST